MLFNARSLRNKTVGVTEFITENNCDACFITEAWLKLKDTSIVQEIDMGYSIKFTPRKVKRGGGVCVLYKDVINIKKCNVTLYESFEVLEVTRNGKSDIIRVSTIYRTGKMSTEGRNNFINELDDYLQSLCLKKGEKLLVGDFNIHVHEDGDLDTKALYLATESYGFCQVLNQPTHKNGGTLDLVFAQAESKCLHSIQESLYVYDICHSLTSDHNFIEFTVPFTNKVIKSKHVKLSYRDYKNVNPKLLCDDFFQFVNDKTQDFFNENTELATTIFHDCLTKAIEKHAPLINVSVKPRRTPFTSTDILELRRKRRKAERMYRKYGGQVLKTQYDSLVKEVQNLVKNTRNDFYINELASCSGNNKDTFKVFDKLLGKNKEKHLPSYDNEMDLCNEFEQYFINKIHTIRNDISNLASTATPCTQKHCEKDINTLNKFKILTDPEITEIINHLPNKHCNLDPISTELFKRCIPYLLPYVKYIVNSSLQTGMFQTVSRKH